MSVCPLAHRHQRTVFWASLVVAPRPSVSSSTALCRSHWTSEEETCRSRCCSRSKDWSLCRPVNAAGGWQKLSLKLHQVWGTSSYKTEVSPLSLTVWYLIFSAEKKSCDSSNFDHLPWRNSPRTIYCLFHSCHINRTLVRKCRTCLKCLIITELKWLCSVTVVWFKHTQTHTHRFECVWHVEGVPDSPRPDCHSPVHSRWDQHTPWTDRTGPNMSVCPWCCTRFLQDRRTRQMSQ